MEKIGLVGKKILVQKIEWKNLSWKMDKKICLGGEKIWGQKIAKNNSGW